MSVRNVELRVANHAYSMQAMVLEKCVFLWIGKQCKMESLFFARNNNGMPLLEPLNMDNNNLLGYTCKISSLFPTKQVFFSTDLTTTDPSFWLELSQKISDEVCNNKSFYSDV